MGETGEAEPSAACQAQPLFRMSPVQRLPRAGAGDQRAAGGDRGTRRARPSRRGARSRRGDAALLRPHRVRRERRPRPHDRRPRRDLARALPGASEPPPQRPRRDWRSGWAGPSSCITPTVQRRRSCSLCITAWPGLSGIIATVRRSHPVPSERRAERHDHHRQHRLPPALDFGGARGAARHLVAAALHPACPACRGVPADAAPQGPQDHRGDSGAQPVVADRAPHAARGFDHPCAGAPGAEPGPAELRRHWPAHPRHRQWLGVRRALGRAARGDRGGHR